MTIAEINSRITFFTGLGTDIYLPADRLIAINNGYDKFHSVILGSQDEWDFDDSNYTTLPIANTELTANTGTYALPSTIYKLNKVEINYGSGFVKAIPLDLNETNLSETEVLSLATVEQPRYRVFGGTIKLYPTPTATVSGGLQLYYDREVDSFTSSQVTTGTKKPGFDRIFHDYIALSASIDGAIKFTLSNLVSLQNQLIDLEKRAEKFFGSKVVDRNYQFKGNIEDYS